MGLLTPSIQFAARRMSWSLTVRCTQGFTLPKDDRRTARAQAGDRACLTPDVRSVCNVQGSEDGEDCGMDMSNVDEMYMLFADRLEAVDNAAPAAPLHVKHGKVGAGGEGPGRWGCCMSSTARCDGGHGALERAQVRRRGLVSPDAGAAARLGMRAGEGV